MLARASRAFCAVSVYEVPFWDKSLHWDYSVYTLTPRGYRIATLWGGAVPNLGGCTQQRAYVDLCTWTRGLIRDRKLDLLEQVLLR